MGIAARALSAAATAWLLFVVVPDALAAPEMDVGFYDEALTLEYPDDYGFRTLRDLGADVVRMNLYWHQVAETRPRQLDDPRDPAYRWWRYDRAIRRANAHGVEVIFSIIGTPGWANGGKSWQYAPGSSLELELFARAAAKRYPGVRRWLAWNEPNAPNFLKPQSFPLGHGWRFTSPVLYARICNAVVDGVNEVDAGDEVACGVLNPRGKPEANGKRDSVAPVTFLEAMKDAGARPEVIAYHPYAWAKWIAPTAEVKSRNAITLGNLDRLVSAVDRLYGREIRLWVTEYGYQTNPPDPTFGVSWSTQAMYMRQAFGIMRAHPRIDLALWFQLKDDSRLAGWQSGVISNPAHELKPSYRAFRQLARP